MHTTEQLFRPAILREHFPVLVYKFWRLPSAVAHQPTHRTKITAAISAQSLSYPLLTINPYKITHRHLGERWSSLCLDPNPTLALRWVISSSPVSAGRIVIWTTFGESWLSLQSFKCCLSSSTRPKWMSLIKRALAGLWSHSSRQSFQIHSLNCQTLISNGSFNESFPVPPVTECDSR